MSTKPSSEETPDLQGAYPRLSDAQIAALDAQGRRRPTQPGDVLFVEGDRDCDFFVVLAGKAASVEGHGTPEAIVGAGNSAGQAAVFLSAHAAQVTLIVREHDLGEHMSRYLVDEIARIGNVHVMTGTDMRELHGEAALEAITVTDNWTGTRRTIDARALFVFIGMAPCTCWLGGLVDLDDREFVRTGEPSARCWRRAGPASSRSATSAPARPNASPPPSVRARWRSGSPPNEQVPPRRSTMMEDLRPDATVHAT
jgi:hypothetical protein